MHLHTIRRLKKVDRVGALGGSPRSRNLEVDITSHRLAISENGTFIDLQVTFLGEPETRFARSCKALRESPKSPFLPRYEQEYLGYVFAERYRHPIPCACWFLPFQPACTSFVLAQQATDRVEGCTRQLLKHNDPIHPSSCRRRLAPLVFVPIDVVRSRRRWKISIGISSNL